MMDFRYPPETEAFRKEVREFLSENVTPEYLEERRTMDVSFDGHGPATQAFVDKLIERAYLIQHWPKEYGGAGRSFLDMAVFSEEMARAGATTNVLGLVGYNIVAPALMHFGTAEQKRTFLPKIASGEWIFCQMFTEPGAGSDLAALSTTALRDGDEYVVNGSKTFTTRAHLATHGYLLARTEPQAPRHRGVSLFVLKMDTPGVDVRPLRLVDGSRHNSVYMEDVRLPASALVGEENRGWYHAMVSFDFERAGLLGFVLERERNMQAVLDYARATQQGGQSISKAPHIRPRLVEAYRDAKVQRALALRVVDQRAHGRVPNAESSELSLQAKQGQGRLAELAGLVYGSYVQLLPDTHRAIPDGLGIRTWWVLPGRHAGGTAEIQQNIIAQRGLGLPRS
jgi:alkylation response protein AidB-like acyl-CoA dehydrogenase